MKKTLIILINVLILTSLYGCRDKIDKHQIVFDELSITFLTEEENENYVINDITFSIQSKEYEDALIKWESSNVNVLEISDNIGFVNRPLNNNETINVYIYILINEIEKQYIKELTIIKKDNNQVKDNDYYILSYRIDGVITNTFEVLKNTSVELLDSPYKKDHIFIGWSYNNKVVKDELLITKNVVLVAVFNNIQNHNTIKINSLKYESKNGLSLIQIKINKQNDITGVLFININDYLFKEIRINEETELYIDGINIVGEYKLEIIHSSNIDIKEILITDNSYLNIIKEDLLELKVNTIYYKNTSLKLTEQGIRGTKYDWFLENEKDSFYIDLIKRNVILKENDNIEIKINVKANFMHDEIIKQYTLKLGEPEISSIKEVNSFKNRTIVKTQGVITGLYKEGLNTYIYIKDKEDNILLKTTRSIKYTQGTVIEVIGEFVNGIINADLFTHKDKNDFNYKLIYETNDFKENLYNYIYIEGIVTENLINNKFSLFIDKDVSVYVKTSELVEVNKGSYIELYGYVDIVNKKYVIIVTDVLKINTFQLTNNQIIESIMTELGFNELITYVINEDMKLPERDSKFASEIKWESKNPEYFSNEGVYNAPDNIVETTLVATIILDDIILGYRTYKIKILPK